MIRKEYGGYLPFETRKGEDFFSRYGNEHVLRTNSGKAAIYYALAAMKIRKIHVPHYICDSVNKMLEDTGLETERFFLDDRMLPRLENVREDEGVLLVNYFGVMEATVREAAQNYPQVIVDNTHCFYAPPVFREGVFNVYSCRKFVGVPDGGYLVGQALPEMKPEPDQIRDHFSYLVTSFELGTNAAYQEKQASDRHFIGHYAGMSRLSEGMLVTVDYDELQKKRKENFGCLHDCLKKYNGLDIPEISAAWMYPFWRKGTGRELKKALVAEKIYTPTLWRELLRPEFEGTLEFRLSDELVFLPVDQRYGREDMKYLAGRVLALGGMS
ncbi:MAG: hypothetical protein LUF78_13220 [Clostridiales bacterium]|nr:hypothetical protein [Clostridiales bacterium]